MPVAFAKDDNDLQRWVRQNPYLMINYTTLWCGPCQQIKPVIDGVYDDNAQYTSVDFVRVDGDKQIGSQYQVSAFPTFIFLQRGREVARVAGANVQQVQVELAKLQEMADADEDAEGRKGNKAEIKDDAVKKFVPKGYEVLNPTIDFGLYEALNAEGNLKGVFKSEGLEEPVYSDADSQLMFYVPFLNISKVFSILIKSRKGSVVDDEEGQLPLLLKVWANRPSVPSFDDAVGDKNAPHIEKIVYDKDLEWVEVRLKFVRFQKVQTLCIFIDGDDEDTHTVVDKIVLVGLSGDSTEQATIAKEQ